MGIFDFFKKARPESRDEPQKAKVEEENQNAVSLEDMAPFNGKPFAFDSPIKNVGPCFDPWRMDLSQENQFVAMDQVASINSIVQQAYQCSESIPIELCIPEARIDYKNSSIICNPRTKTGKPAKYPFSLLAQTPSDVGNDTSVRIDYFQDGTMGKAKVVIWNNHVMYALSYKTVGRSFVLSEVKTNKGLDRGEIPCVIYKA